MATSSQYDSFIRKLKEIFMMDQADLDFGIYRIMNQKRQDIQQFLEHDLLPQVKTILKDNTPEAEMLQQELDKTIKTLRDAGVNPDEAPKVQQLKAQLAKGGDMVALENNVYSHLTTFFGRYYDAGDFISKRRYKDNTYAIPYNGEEVKLHWANADQYYIKTSENFKDYSFKLSDGRLVHFSLKDATTEQNNNKAQNNQERRFTLFVDEKGNTPTVETVDGELHINFAYELMPKATKQNNLNAQTLDKLRTLIPEEWAELLAPVSDADNRALVEKHLTDYTAKNTFDYFIHKDLGTFLRRELDFYIKNEVLHIDDLDAQRIQSQLATMKAIKSVGEKIICMLAQLEDFQKKLWLKKKFVVQTDYCITLDRVPREFYSEICQNEAQREEWVRLFAIDDIRGDMLHQGYSVPLTEQFLEENPFLVLDTQFFPADFKHRLVSKMENIDENCNGLLINSENFQALELLQEKYTESVKCIYMDPPYNTSEVGFVYKNNYRHSSWATMMCDRLKLSFKNLSNNGALFITIDDEELYDLKQLTDSVLGTNNYIGTIVIEANPRGRGINSFYATCHEYCIAYAKNPSDVVVIDNELTEEQQNQYGGNDDEEVAYRLLPFRRSGGWSTPEDRPNSEFPLYFDNQGVLFAVGAERICPAPLEYSTSEILVWDTDLQTVVHLSPDSFYQKYPTAVKIMPIDTQGMRRVWRWSDREKILRAGAMGDFVLKSDNRCKYVQLKDRIKAGRKPKTVWVDSKYDSSTHGTNLLKDILGKRNSFGFPKSVYSTEDTLHSIIGDDEPSNVLDIFGGSGTTAHSVIQLNRKDEGKRRYILCEMGEYFSTVTKPRIEKVVYSSDWRDGKPVSRAGISQCFKYIRLEQYEDTLNNLVMEQPAEIFDKGEDGGWKETYMLGYMMDTETRGSLFNMEWFKRPFNMTLKTTKNNELVETHVDMVETFNFLIGLEVDTEQWHQQGHICAVEGRLHRTGEAALVIWRDCEYVSNEALNEFFSGMDYSTQGRKFDVIYVNGDNTLSNLRRSKDRWKVVLTEEEFQSRMFEEE